MVLTGLLGPWGSVSAWAQEVPLDDLLVAAPGTTMELLPSTADAYDGTSFVENFDLDITVVAEVQGALREEDGSPRLLVTAIRLSSAREAAEVLRALDDPVLAEDTNSSPEVEGFWAELDLPAPSVETLPRPRRDAVARRIVVSEDHAMVEMAWATGRDVVTLVDLDPLGPGDAPPSLMHEMLDAHRGAFPDVTMPAGTRAGPWKVIGAVVVAVLAVVALFLALAGRGRRTSSPVRPSAGPVNRPGPDGAPPPPGGDGPPRARANW